jgi:hypothetical protein
MTDRYPDPQKTLHDYEILIADLGRRVADLEASQASFIVLAVALATHLGALRKNKYVSHAEIECALEAVTETPLSGHTMARHGDAPRDFASALLRAFRGECGEEPAKVVERHLRLVKSDDGVTADPPSTEPPDDDDGGDDAA